MVRRVLAAVSMVVTLALVAACGSTPDRPFAGNTLQSPFTMPQVELTDDQGNPFSTTADTTKRLTLVFFGYVDCVDVCPAVLDQLASAIHRIDEADREQVQVIMVSSNPDVDNPEYLHNYLQKKDPSFIGLTGSWDDVVTVASGLKVALVREDPGAHQTQVFGLDSADEVPVYWDADTTSGQYASDIHALLKDS